MKTKQVYLVDQEGNYYYEGAYCYLVGPVTKEQAQTMSEDNAQKIIECNKHLHMEDAK